MKGLGAAVIQKNGVVAYSSRALTPAEKRYALIEKGMLVVVFGCEKFQKLLYMARDALPLNRIKTVRDNDAKTYFLHQCEFRR